MLISTRGRYALRILIDMAENSHGSYIKLRDIADRQDISEKYLESLIKELVRSRIVEGLRGKGGGYRLSREPDQINIGEVLRLMEGGLAPVACLEEAAPPCPKAAACRTLGFWQGLNDVIRRYTDSYTLADLIHTAPPGDDYVI